MDYTVSLCLGQAKSPRLRRGLVGISLTINLGTLAAFKYFDFFLDSFYRLIEQFGLESGGYLNIALPIGISFYTFQTISYTIDVYRDRLKPTRSVVDYLVYVAFFPQLVAGPIERGAKLLPQFLKPRQFDAALATDGMRQILWGLVQKMVVADNLGRIIVNPIFNDVPGNSGPALLFATVCFAFQIYCDFAAYSNIAIGSARLLGFDLMRNFAYPYFSQSVDEFWRRWHISLSTWFRDYLYIPLGGNRKGHSRYIFNVLLTFAISGFWHGAAWTFVIWGVLNGIGVLPRIGLGRLNKSKRQAETMPGGTHLLPHPIVLLRILSTFAFICLTWVFFRANSLSDALMILQRIALDASDIDAWRTAYHRVLLVNKGAYYFSLALILIGFEWFRRGDEHPLQLGNWPKPIRWLIYTVLFWLAIYYIPRNASDFIYFQF